MHVLTLYRILRMEPGSTEWSPTSVKIPGRARKRQALFTMHKYAKEAVEQVRPTLPEGTHFKIQMSDSGFPWKDVR